MKFNYKKIALILAIVLIGFLAFFTYEMSSGQIVSKFPIEMDIQKIETQSSSTDTASIETDLKNTDLSNLDKEITDIQYQLVTP